MDQIIAVFSYDRAGVDLPPTDLKLTGYYEPEDLDIEDLEDRFAVNLEERTVEVLTTFEKLHKFSFLILLNEVKTRLAGWWGSHYIQVRAYYRRREMLRGEIMEVEQIVAIFDYSDGGVNLPPEDFKLMGYYIPEEFDLDSLEYGVAVYLDNQTVEILTTLNMLHRKNLPALLEQVEEDTAEWWENHSDQVNAHCKEKWQSNMRMYKEMRGEL